MRRSTLIVVITVVLTFGFTAYEAREITRGRASIAAEFARLARHKQQLVELQRQRDEAQRDLEAAKEILASSGSSSATSSALADRAAQTDKWLTRAKRLKQSFEEHPDQYIPEFRLLTDLDWLTLTRQAKLESHDDLRRVWAEARNLAYGKLAPKLATALREFAAASNGAEPTDLSQLLAYLKPPIDGTILQRYEITDGIDHGARKRRRIITERAPVDAEFDTRHNLVIDGRGSGGGLWSHSVLSQSRDDATYEFYTANPGRRPSKDTDLLPYVRNPSVKAIFEAKVAYQNDHHGGQSSKSADLRPYVIDPTARSLLENMIKAEERRSAQ